MLGHGTVSYTHLDVYKRQGYDLYCKMLNQAVLALKGETLEEASYDTVVECDIDAYIPEMCIRDRCEYHLLWKRILLCEGCKQWLLLQGA